MNGENKNSLPEDRAMPEQKPTPKSESEQLKEFLKRGEVRTMEKDVARLREKETLIEREKISSAGHQPPEPVPAPQKPKPAPAEIKKQPPLAEGIIPKQTVRKPTLFEKILVRLIFILFLVFIATFLYWFFFVRNQPKETAFPPPKEIVLSPSYLTEDGTEIIEILKSEEVSGKLAGIAAKEFPKNTFIRLAVKNKSEDQQLSLENLMGALGIEAPSEIYQKTEPGYNLFAFNHLQGQRMVLIAKIKEGETVENILKNWEAELVKNGLLIKGSKTPLLVPVFRQASSQKAFFRYLTISKDDRVAGYSAYNNYLIFTDSLQGFQKTIEKLNI